MFLSALFIPHNKLALVKAKQFTTSFLSLLIYPNTPHLSRQRSLSFSLAMADITAETFSSVAVLDGEDSVSFGFERPEMHSANLSGTVQPPYDRHVFLCYRTYDAWPARIETSDADPLPKLLAETYKARKNDVQVKTRITVCEGRDGTELVDGDVLIFPDMIKYRGLTETGVESFVEDVLVNGKPWTAGVQEVLAGSHVFICAHNSRDRRCGVCGPALIEKFIEEIKLKGLKNQVMVSACSHIGGHKYAGNLIIFSEDSEGKVSGHWYGYVAPDDVPELLDQHIGKGEIIERIWSIGEQKLSNENDMKNDFEKEAEKVDEQKLPNGNEAKKEPQPRESSQEEKPTAQSCCQGDDRISCCREQTADEELPLQKTKTSCCQSTNGNSSGSNEVLEKEVKKPLGRLRSWAGKWEQHEVYAAAGVVGAVATAGVVYSLYRRSR
ncbi:hypothetical protein DCAR_0624489 [Daucus carota subsp. sativus]|uniref:Altered inheritance of mitochondria protein 32 n=1 Tax=Daucus carota subsp. sativus TaxID=79200 RepID=A0AAF1B5T9_DAUCS|nr:hypothetical protein DCAR_0624489 [Daucus carota subsp. sativus]